MYVPALARGLGAQALWPERPELLTEPGQRERLPLEGACVGTAASGRPVALCSDVGAGRAGNQRVWWLEGCAEADGGGSR
jgi:hypothetical protein